MLNAYYGYNTVLGDLHGKSGAEFGKLYFAASPS